MEYSFNLRSIEKKWQEFWKRINLYKTPEKPKRKYYVLEMFPYTSGDLHMGHLKNYVIGDVVARVKIMEGYDILHPIGWDAFGLPAENAAIKHGIHPRTWTYNNIENFRKTFDMLGLSYDWDREIATCDPEYYKWTQWLFLLLYKRGLAYRKAEYVNWCPSCKTVLANEQVVDGKCERCKSFVIKKELEQWFFKITSYADRLLDDLVLLKGKWPENIIKQQENWIGRSYGTRIIFKYEKDGSEIPVFTTRADTLFGVTFITIAPEHEFVKRLIADSPYGDTIKEYVDKSVKKSDVEREFALKEKSGVFTGLFAIHPLTNEKVPIWVGDYVLAHYGTGVVMGVPAHDQRDFEFARKNGLPIRVVIKPVDGELDPESMDRAYEDYGIMTNSGKFNGLTSESGIAAIQDELERLGLGGKAVSYRLRDWLISRQRYWGAPIPMVHCPECGIVPVPEADLPVLLPENIKDFKPKGRSPLEDVEEWINTSCPKCGGPAKRDPDTMDTFVDSSWYFLRYIDAKNGEKIFDSEKVNTWMPVDQYIGGVEHATKHLIYARFIQKVLYDEGLVNYPEPFENLFTQGLVHKSFYYCRNCGEVAKDEDVKENVHIKCGNQVEILTEMMSKSRGNIVAVAPFVEEHGTDVARITILFAGPAEKDMIWSDSGVEGAKRFLLRILRIYAENGNKVGGRKMTVDKSSLQGKDKELYIKLQQTIQAVKEDSLQFHFNTAIARMMEFLNDLYSFEDRNSYVFLKSLIEYAVLLAPFAPHVAEEIWNYMGFTTTIFNERYPEYDQEFLHFEEVEIPVQINGKVRSKVVVKKGSEKDEVLNAALNEEKIRNYIGQSEILNVIYVPDRLLNIVVKNSGR
ncbi:MAG: leucine--tRNA ligase [candidate division WOR-3 bacterium]